MPTKKPNILIIWGDDIGWFNISAYNHGVMGYRTPNIDRIGREGALFTDWYGQQSCTAGRAAVLQVERPATLRASEVEQHTFGASFGHLDLGGQLPRSVAPAGHVALD